MASDNHLGRFLAKIAELSLRFPTAILLAVAAVTAGAIFVARNIAIDPALESLIPKDRPVTRKYVQAERDFKHTEFMISVIELPGNLPVIRYRKFLRTYQSRLRQIPELDAGRLNVDAPFVLKVTDYLKQHGLLMMDGRSLDRLNELLDAGVIQAKLKAPEPFRLYLDKSEFDPLDIQPLIQSMVPLGNRAYLDRSKEFFVTQDPNTVFFIVGNDLPWDWGRTHRILDQAAKIEKAAWQETLPDAPYPKISWIGKALDIRRMTTVIWEAFAGSIIWTSILVALIFLLIFPSIRALFLAYIPVFVALVWSVAFTRLTVGKLNMLSVVVWGMLIGLGIDFPSYLLNSYFIKREKGLSMEEAIKSTWHETGPPMTIGAFNVILVFAILLASRLPAFRDIGLISCSGLLFSLGLVLVTLPALIRLTEGRRIPRAVLRYPHSLIRIPLHRPRATVLIALLILGGLSLFIVRFRLQSAYEETYFMYRQPAEVLSQADRRFSELMGSSLSPFRLVVAGDSWEEALEKNEALAGLLKKYQASGGIAWFDSLYYFLPSQKRQESSLQIIPQLGNLNPESFSQRYAGNLEAILSDQNVPRAKKSGYKVYGREIAELLRGNLATNSEVLKSAGLEKVLNHYYSPKNDRIQLATYVYLPRGHYPELKESLMTRLREEPMFRDGEVESTSDEDEIGEIRKILKGDLFRLGGLSLLVTTALIYFAFRSVKMTLYAAMPMVLGASAAVGAYTLMRGGYSIFNILWVPIYIGMACDDVLHIGSHIVDEGSSIAEALRKAGGIVILTSVTTMIGFGSSLFTDIEILKRISVWIVLALGAELLASLFLFPAILRMSRDSGPGIAQRNKS